MSHTTVVNTDFDEQETVFIHNGGYDGDVEIVRGENRLSVPFDALKQFVADYVRAKKISDLEDAIPETVFGL